MSTLTLKNFHTSSRWTQLSHGIAEFRRRMRSRGELMNLSDHTLRDIGMSRCDAISEGSKPFWTA